MTSPDDAVEAVFICECGSVHCVRKVVMDCEEKNAIFRAGCIVIAAGCDTIPAEGDRFVVDRGTYQVWTDGERD